MNDISNRKETAYKDIRAINHGNIESLIWRVKDNNFPPDKLKLHNIERSENVLLDTFEIG